MKFSLLSQYFKKLEETSSRLDMIAILSDLLRKADPSEIDKVVYLCMAQLKPPYTGVELGMGEKLIMRSIAMATGKPVEEVSKLYKEIGDLGSVAEKLVTWQGAGLEVSEVYERLLKIAETSGEGAIKRKVELLASLIKDCSPLEAVYLVRFVDGKLRLGAGDATIMEALSLAKTGTRKLKARIELKYNYCSDLGLVARKFMEKGISGLEEIKITPGIPVRPALAERLQSPEEIIKKIGKCSVEAKYDGFRCQVHKDGETVEIFSRRLERTTHMFPEIVKGARKQIAAEQAIIEGEALAYNEDTGEFYPFQVTIQRKRKYGVEEMAKEYPLKLFCFDLLYLDGEDYTRKPYITRFNKLLEILREGEVLVPAERIITDDPKELHDYFMKLIERGLEGIVAKRLNSPYQAGARNFNWIKLKRSYRGKLADTIDVVIIGYFKGRGKRAKFGVGALLGAVYDKETDTFKTVAKIGSGLTEEQLTKLNEIFQDIKMDHKPPRVDSLIEPDVWVQPKLVFTVKADEITRSPVHTCGKEGDQPGYALRFPRVEGWIREDKAPEDATTVKEIIEMYEQQFVHR
ncbi:MAG TPA: ATP-dependent DNA ligase [Candidatus Bathyarchaeota archaeon]|nr:ATP-dependent DNA ligase [Candidatus Bathyarchaeota archaeon]